MKYRPLAALSLFAAIILTAGCSPELVLPAAEAAPPLVRPALSPIYAAEDCPVTRPPDPPFVPPAPWPAEPPGDVQFWLGSAGLWTALPTSGSWSQLARGEKFWWWSELYGEEDVLTDMAPDLSVSARRLDASAPTYLATEATNGFHPSFNQAMLVGVTLPSPGCWQIEGEFQGSRLSLIVWVPPE
jgi:hypothetical protein